MIHTATHITQFLLTIGIFVILPIGVLVSGFLIMTAGGSSERLAQGKNVSKGVGVGLLIAIGAYIIVGTALWAVGARTGSGGEVGWPEVSCI
jgi:hypothetical protein